MDISEQIQLGVHFVDNLGVLEVLTTHWSWRRDWWGFTFNICFTTISVTERKLRATWSPEFTQQDIPAFHNIDTEAELTSLLSEQISAEIDREILRDLVRQVIFEDLMPTGWKHPAGCSTNYTQKDWNQELF